MGNQNDKNLQIMNLEPKACCNNFSLYVSNGKVDSSEISCSVCFKVFSSPRLLKCKHVFCDDCIQEWAKGSTVTCPLCRKESKRTRGSFGRGDKRLQNKISKLFMKCRNCCWTGSYCQFLTQFSLQPYLDDQVVPCEKIIEEKVGQQEEIIEEKVEVKEALLQVEKNQQQKAKNDEDSVVQLLKISKTSQGQMFFENVFDFSQKPFDDQPLVQNENIGSYEPVTYE